MTPQPMCEGPLLEDFGRWNVPANQRMNVRSWPLFAFTRLSDFERNVKPGSGCTMVHYEDHAAFCITTRYPSGSANVRPDTSQ
jgi:hypothetical protein